MRSTITKKEINLLDKIARNWFINDCEYPKKLKNKRYEIAEILRHYSCGDLQDNPPDIVFELYRLGLADKLLEIIRS